MGASLPKEFADLEPFAADWCLDTESQRYDKRLSSSMEELTAFYDACFPRLEDAIAHCDRFPLDDLPDEERRLLQLVYSLVMVSMAVEIFHQPKAVDAADARLERVTEPLP
jgi:hypothetical protein